METKLYGLTRTDLLRLAYQLKKINNIRHEYDLIAAVNKTSNHCQHVED